MKRLLAVVLLSLVSLLPANAGTGMLMGVGGKAGVTYVGLFNALGSTPQNYYALRAGSAAIAAAGTQKLVTAIASNGGSPITCDILVASSGGLGATGSGCSSGVGVAAATFCAQGGGSCTVSVWFDQGTNAANVLQGTLANQPVLTFNCDGTLPCLHFNGTSTTMTASITTSAQPFILSAVSERTALFSTRGGIFGTFFLAQEYNVPNGMLLFANSTATFAAADSVFIAVQGYYNGASSVANFNGTETTLNPGAGTLDTNLALGNAGGDHLTGNIEEAAIVIGTSTTTVRNTICHNQMNYRGAGGTC